MTCGSETLGLNLRGVFIPVFPRSLLGSRGVNNILHELRIRKRTLDDRSGSNLEDSCVRTVGIASPGCHGIEPVGVGPCVDMICYRWAPPEDVTVVGAVDLSSTRRGRAEGKFSSRLHADETADKPMRQIRKGVTSPAGFGP